MVIRDYVKGIVFVVLIFGFLSSVMAITMTPSGTDLSETGVVGVPKTFSITSISNNATVTWYINETIDQGPTLNQTSSTYINNTPMAGIWNVSVFAINSSNSSDVAWTRWWWTVTAATSSGNTTPSVTITGVNIKDTSADIQFSVNQSNVKTRINYGIGTLDSWSDWKNDTASPITIPISGLTKGTTYQYTVYAYNGSNQSLFTNSSPVSIFTTIDPTGPNVTSASTDTPTSSSANVTFDVNQTDAKAIIQYGLTESLGTPSNWKNTTPRVIMLSGLTGGKTYYYSVFAYNGTNQTYSSNSTIKNFTTKFPPPTITDFSPSDLTPEITVSQSQEFAVKADQNVTVRWYKDGSEIKNMTVDPNQLANYTFSGAKGNYTIVANASNVNGSTIKTWNLYVRSASFYTGNRIWDGSKPEDFGLTYSWNPMSFPGFYYNLKDDVGNENITITLSSYNDRTINENDLKYSTTPQEVSFTYSPFGKYQVIGFMADKYFAGYKNTTLPNPTTNVGDKSVIASGQLHKVLMDDDTKKSISVGSTLALKDGYVLKAKDIDMGARTMLLALLKDGVEIDEGTPLSKGQTYVFTKKIGSVSDMPLVIARFEDVFSGREVQAAFIKGIFQISETATAVKSGDRYGRMEISSVSETKIEMNNADDISLSSGSKQDVMGDVKIIVADNSSVVRFALSVEKTGAFEVRSSIFKEGSDAITAWTPYNFGMNVGQTSFGFYYDLDDGVGNESMRITGTSPTSSTRKIDDGNLVYSTTPENVKFTYSSFGRYQVIGFMAEKYFAGYTDESIPATLNPTTSVGDKSVIDSGQLHKVLIDDDTKRTIAVGSTLALKDGYVLKAIDIDMGARTMLLALLKDGVEVDEGTPVTAGQTYVYTKKVGSVSDLPIVIARFDSVFSGKEVQAAFLKGLFQISETATTIKSGDKFGKMEVGSVSRNMIEMSNDGSIGLDKNKNEDLMGKIKLKVADSDTLRFYFAVDVTPDMVGSQLVIEAPAKAMAGDNISIKVKAGGNAVDNASVSLDTDLGNTDSNGILNYTLPKTLKGMYNITATKLGYEKAVKAIEIEKYIDLRLSLDIPATTPQFDPLKIKVTYNGSAMSGASVKFDNDVIGTTDGNGELNYAPQVSGTHTITASKSGYVAVSRDIDVIVPYSEFKALDINITPDVATPGLKLLIKSNITNSGTKGDTLPVDLIINGTAVKNTTLTLDRGATKEINFTGNLREWMKEEVKPGNYTVEILGKTQLLPVKEEPLNLVLVGGAIVLFTAIGGGIIYFLTSKNMISIDALRDKMGDLLNGLKNIRK